MNDITINQFAETHAERRVSSKSGGVGIAAPFLKVKTYVDQREFKSRLKESNNENIVSSFLKGAMIDHTKFGGYVFIPNTTENDMSLKARGFYRDNDFISKMDNLMEMGDNVLYNKELNLLFVLISPSKWDALIDAIFIAKNSNIKQYEIKCKVVHTTFLRLTKK